MPRTESTPLLEALAQLYPDSSRTTLRQMLQNGRVRVNGDTEKDAKRLIDPDEILEVIARSDQRVLPPGIAILHEDRDIIVILKSQGLLTVATEREREATVQAYLNAYLGSGGEDRVQVVHRLDRDTSGVLVFAKNFFARERLKEQFMVHSVERIYVAVIEGAIEPAEGTIESDLFEQRDLKMVSVDAHPDAKHAVTHYRTIGTKGPYSMLEVTLETGRKNQIRAHLSEAGHPVAGDKMYGAKTNPLGRLGLHAKLLGFDHPTTGQHLVFTAALPKAFRDVLR
ncbi:MAG TPA: RluA family pseudouridine synthase [Thermoanaerobaculia bacterium]|nr:RluA family pseudouridine synthase [Thermoanaerobaculia bacterium]